MLGGAIPAGGYERRYVDPCPPDLGGPCQQHSALASITTVAAFRPWRGSQSSNAEVPAEAIEACCEYRAKRDHPNSVAEKEGFEPSVRY